MSPLVPQGGQTRGGPSHVPPMGLEQHQTGVLDPPYVPTSPQGLPQGN